MKSESGFSCAIASQPCKRFHMEKNWAQKYICGEKMTNIRSASVGKISDAGDIVAMSITHTKI